MSEFLWQNETRKRKRADQIETNKLNYPTCWKMTSVNPVWRVPSFSEPSVESFYLQWTQCGEFLSSYSSRCSTIAVPASTAWTSSCTPAYPGTCTLLWFDTRCWWSCRRCCGWERGCRGLTHTPCQSSHPPRSCSCSTRSCLVL